MPSELLTGRRTELTVTEYHLLRIYEQDEPYADDQATFACVRAIQLEYAKRGVRTSAAELAPHWFAARWFEQDKLDKASKQNALLRKIEQIPWGKPPQRKKD